MNNFIQALNEILRNKQFWLGLIGVALIVIKAFYPAFPISEEAITTVVLTVVGVIFGISFSANAMALNAMNRAAAAKPARTKRVRKAE